MTEQEIRQRIANNQPVDAIDVVRAVFPDAWITQKDGNYIVKPPKDEGAE